jgi:glycosyltransferase involved in cell wall biosynthesis
VAERTRILLLIPRLRAGGAEQVMGLIARGLSRETHDVHLGLVMSSDAGETALPPWVTIHALGAKRARNGAVPLLRLVWRIRPTVILSGAAEISFLVLLLRQFFPPHTKVLVRQNGTVSASLASGTVPGYTRLLYKLLYRRADRIICQSRAMAEDLARELRIDRDFLTVLPNPVDLEGIRRARKDAGGWKGAGPHLLTIGRLSREKGFDLLIGAMVQVRARFPDAELIIAGAGPEEAELKQLCREVKLQQSVRFMGRVDRPYDLFPGASLFVLSSRYEGMPNAMLEAAAAGLPLVATPASGGVIDLLRARSGAWLAPEISAQALAATLINALESLRPEQRFCHQFFPSMGHKPEHATETAYGGDELPMVESNSQRVTPSEFPH